MSTAPVQQPSPDFLGRALFTAQKGIPIIPIKPDSKAAFLPNWETLATTDVQQITKWSVAYSSDYNCAAVATGEPDGIWIFESDSPEVIARIKAETGRDLMEINTFMVRSRKGRGHVYFRNSPAALAMGNLAQSAVKGGDFSVRVHNQYVVAAGSIHPATKLPYDAMTNAPLAVAPQWFIDWLLAQRVEKGSAGKNATPRNEAGRVPHGSIHPFLVSEAGKLRHAGLDADVLEVALVNIAENQCEPPIDFDKVKKIAHSGANSYEMGAPNIPLKLSSQPDPAVLPVIDTSEGCSRPDFPVWAVDQTSVWKGLVEPALATSSKHGEFIFMPAMQMIMNYL
jgi:hypothetical protein